MDDNQFWYQVWKIISIIVCVIILTIGGCISNTNIQTRILIEKTGVNPLDAYCAISNGGNNGDVAICSIRAAK